MGFPSLLRPKGLNVVVLQPGLAVPATLCSPGTSMFDCYGVGLAYPVESGTVRVPGNLFVDLQYGQPHLRLSQRVKYRGLQSGMASGARLQLVNTK